MLLVVLSSVFVLVQADQISDEMSRTMEHLHTASKNAKQAFLRQSTSTEHTVSDGWVNRLREVATIIHDMQHIAAQEQSQQFHHGQSAKTYRDDHCSVDVTPATGCSGRVTLTDLCGTFSDGEGDYATDLACEWIFEPENPPTPQYNIRLEVLELALEDPNQWGCQYDALSLYKGSSWINSFCGYQDPFVVVEPSPLSVIFISDESATYAGFTVKWTIEPGSPPPAICNATLTTQPEGEAELSDLTCPWTLNPPNMTIVTLQVLSWDMDDPVHVTGRCPNSYLNVIDRFNSTDQRIFGQYCGVRAPVYGRCTREGEVCMELPNIVVMLPLRLHGFGRVRATVKWQSCVSLVSRQMIVCRYPVDPRPAEKAALLEIMDSLRCVYPHVETPVVSNWFHFVPVCGGGCLGPNDPLHRCHNWDRVKCDANALHVTGLDLELACARRGSLSSALGSLARLESLNLIASGTVPSQLSRLSHLRKLRLGLHNLVGTFPDLSSSLQLESIDVLKSSLEGPFPPWIGRLEKLREFYWSENAPTNGAPLTLPTELGLLTNLQAFHFRFANLVGTIPIQFGRLSNLRVLSFARNSGLSGTIPTQLGNLEKLNELRLSFSGLHGTLPSQLGRLTALHSLEIGKTALSGTFPSQLGKLARLQEFWCPGVGLSGTLPTQLGRVNNMREFVLTESRMCGTIPSELFAVVTDTLDLTQNLFTHLDPTVVFASKRIMLARNAISSTLPLIVVTELLELSSNAFRGPLRVTTYRDDRKNPGRLSAHSNFIEGTLDSFATNGSHMVHVDLRFNSLCGTLPDTFFWISTLLDNNKIHGTLPASLLSAPTFLSLSGNLISGLFPSLKAEASQLRLLNVRRNLLSGSLPTFARSLQVQLLDMSENLFSGTLPESLSDFGTLEKCYVSSNLLHGSVTQTFLSSASLIEFEASRNRFCGTLPARSSATLQYVDISNNELRGTLPDWLFTSSILKKVRLSRNEISGTLGGDIRLLSLEILSLSFNKLSGTLPARLGGVPTLTTLDIESNPDISGPLADGFWGFGELNVDKTQLVAANNIPSWVHVSSRFVTFQRDNSVLRCPELTSDRISLVTHPQLYNWQFCECVQGFHGRNGRCYPCPSGGDCSDGANLRARRGFWCDKKAAMEGLPALCHPCPSGRCCNEESCDLNSQCATGFIGALCGECAPTYTTTVPVGCVEVRNTTNPERCDGATWITPLIFVLASLYVFYLAATWQPIHDVEGRSFGRFVEYLANVLIYFFQIMPLLIDGLAERTAASSASSLFFILASVCNLSPNLSGGNVQGQCFAPDMTIAQSLAVNFLAPAAFFLAILAFLLARAIAVRFRVPTQRGVVSRLMSTGSYAYSVFIVSELAFSTITKTIFQLVQCVPLQGNNVLFLDGNIECFQTWQIAVLLCVVPLVLYPFVVLRAASTASHTRHCVISQHQHVNDNAWSGVYDALCGPYRGAATPFWAALVLFRRLALIVCATFLQNRVWRAWSLGCLCLLGLVASVQIRPHVYEGTHWADIGLQSSLVLIALVNALMSVYDSEGIPMAATLQNNFGLLLVTCIVIVPVLACLLAVVSWRKNKPTWSPDRGLELQERQVHGLEKPNDEDVWEPHLCVTESDFPTIVIA